LKIIVKRRYIYS